MLVKKLLNYVLDIGEQMLISGGEINRVEDSISRICKAYQVKRVDVFTITSSIVLTVQLAEDDTALTQTRRISKYAIDMDKLDKLNNLCRYICANTPELSYIESELKKISETKTYSPYVQYADYALIAGAFTVFFGGSIRDALVSAVIGILLKSLIIFVQKADKNVVFVNILCSFVMGILAVLAVYFKIGQNFEKIIIGDIMLLISGVALTNSIRDIISGDTIAGLLRLSDAIIIALSISAGFGLASLFFGGMLI